MKRILKYLSFIYFIILLAFLIALVLDLKLCNAQSLTGSTIKTMKQFNNSRHSLRPLRSAATPHISGTGTSTDPYLLHDAADFDSIRYLGKGTTKYYKLAADIDLSIYNFWSPFGNAATSGNYFEAHIDGANHIIKNINLNPLLAYPSLLGCVNGASLENITLQKITLTQLGTTAQQYTGLVYARNMSSGCTFRKIIIDTVTINYRPTGTVPSFYFAAFGLNAGSSNIIQDCHIKNFYVDLRVGTSSGNTVGGFACTGAMSILRCSIQGSLNTERTNANVQTGSLFFGGNITGSITDSYAVGEIKTSETYSTPTIYLSGFIQYRSTITRCYSAVVVDDSLTNSYQSAFIENYSIGSGTVSNCFFDRTLFNRDGAESGSGAVAKTTSELQTQSTFTGWDFTNTWSINPIINSGYPYLK